MKRLQSFGALLGRSRVWLLVALVVLVFTAMGFLNLAIATAGARAERDKELARVERLQEQNIVMQHELNRAQRGEHLGWLAWDYFGRVPKGVGVIESMGPVAPPVQPKPVPPESWWGGFLRRIGLN